MTKRFKVEAKILYQATGVACNERLVPVGQTVLEDGYYRIRRGEFVRIPDEWVGKIVHRQNIRQRHSVSRRTRKSKKKRD